MKKIDFSPGQNAWKHWIREGLNHPRKTNGKVFYDQNIGPRQQTKYQNTHIWYLQGWNFPIVITKYSRYHMTALILVGLLDSDRLEGDTRHNSSDWQAGPSSQLAGLLWTLSCAPGNIRSIFDLETNIQYSSCANQSPASCPDAFFWTLVSFSWWWGEWAENSNSNSIFKIFKLLWLPVDHWGELTAP